MSKVIMTETKIKSIVSNIIEKINNDNFILENNNNKLNNIVIKEIKLACNSEKLIYEGIGYDNYTHEVWYTDSEDSVDTSLITNPTKDETIISGVNVYSIFQRKIHLMLINLTIKMVILFYMLLKRKRNGILKAIKTSKNLFNYLNKL